ncbi:hypothetical protein SAMN06893096_11198 [Geodermatophilus pulveris]|uniref:Uncharacterized protein n=1 Tax=Geodermatophilus pulveris TaxID=1564159 RepID=A0A239IPY5_9ACTN|nr:hypothetical protein [Geodermatophilus pulveris]SNS95617.1 hypothetical protein SAMN06893096_11198 [Geodermatophilus pulveris]
MSQQSTAGPRRPGRPEPVEDRTRPVALPPAPPTRMSGNFAVPPAEAPSPAEPATEPAAVAGPPTTVQPALPPVAGPRPGAADQAPAEPPAARTTDQPTINLPGGTGRPEDAATVTWLAGPGPGPRPYPRVVPRRHPVRNLLLFLLVLALAVGGAWAVLVA